MLDKIKNSISKLIGKKEAEGSHIRKVPASVSKRVSNLRRKREAKNSTKIIPIGVRKFLDDKKSSSGPKNMKPRNIGSTDTWDEKRNVFHRTIQGRRSYATPKPAIDFTYRRKHSNE